MKKGKKHGGHAGKGHTGPIRHPHMKSLLDGHGAKDPHASAEHHSANMEHGMPHGMSPQGEYDGGGEGAEEGGGEGMSGNCEY